MNLALFSRPQCLAEPDMVKAMCLELSQADLKELGRHRGFTPETIASRALVEHVFLSEEGVASAMASLTPIEIAGLHLLQWGGDQVNLEFFQRIYPSAVTANLYASSTRRRPNPLAAIRAAGGWKTASCGWGPIRRRSG